MAIDPIGLLILVGVISVFSYAVGYWCGLLRCRCTR